MTNSGDNGDTNGNNGDAARPGSPYGAGAGDRPGAEPPAESRPAYAPPPQQPQPPAGAPDQPGQSPYGAPPAPSAGAPPQQPQPPAGTPGQQGHSPYGPPAGQPAPGPVPPHVQSPYDDRSGPVPPHVQSPYDDRSGPVPPHSQPGQLGVPTPQPSGGSGLGAVIAVLAVVAVVVVIGAAAAWFAIAHVVGGSSSPAPTGQTGAPTPVPSVPATTAPPSEPATTATSPPANTSARTVTSTRDGVAVSLPAGWTFDKGMLAGFELPSGHIQAIMHAVAIYGDGYCGPKTSSSWHAESGFVTPGSISDKGSVTATAKAWAAAAGEDSKGNEPTPRVAGPKKVTTVGGTKATEAVATVKPFPDKCAPPSLETIVVSVPKAHGGQAIFVLLADQGNAGAVPQAKLDGIVRSLRPVG